MSDVGLKALLDVGFKVWGLQLSQCVGFWGVRLCEVMWLKNRYRSFSCKTQIQPL